MDKLPTLCAIIIASTLLVTPSSASAQCPSPVDQVLTFPGDNASDVPRNVILRAEFPPTRDPLSTPTWIVIDTTSDRVEGTSEWDGQTSLFIPDEELDERAVYVARVTASGTGEYFEFMFVTGTENDDSAPSFSGLSGITWEQQPEAWLLANCRLARGDAFLFSLAVPEPSDDASGDELCYYVYQTSGPGEGGLLARLRADGEPIVLMHSPDDGEGEFCFRVEVMDLAGRLDGNRVERCIEAIAGAIFDDACSAAGSPRDGDPIVLLSLMGLVAMLVWRRRR